MLAAFKFEVKPIIEFCLMYVSLVKWPLGYSLLKKQFNVIGKYLLGIYLQNDDQMIDCTFKK